MTESEVLKKSHYIFTTLLKGIFLLVILCFTFAGPVLAQKSKAQLEKEKKQLLRKREETNKSLRETAEQKQATLGQLSALNQQIFNQSQLIAFISREIQLLDKEMSELGQITYSMENDLANLRKEYAAMIYAASKASSGYSKLVFIFSSETFTQLLMRLKYLQQYSQARTIQVEQIQKIKNILTIQREELNTKKEEKNRLLQARINENNNLLALKNQQNNVINQLTSREKELQEELAEDKKAAERLENLITDLIEEEARRLAAKKAETSAAAASITAAEVSKSSSFAGSKAKLEWPVKGFISGKFGEQPHPVLKGIMIDNNGVNIQTNQGEEVRAVYDGEVGTVASIPGLNKIVFIKHGDYTTVYAKLAKVTVKAGQTVKANQVLGEVYTDKNGTSELQFQIWQNDKKLNPQVWLNDK
jgi:septal ring factor EnvC (AmiA/AmiB activator)